MAGKLCSSMADQLYSCSTCSKQFSSRWGILRHQKKEHGVESEGGVTCQEENCDFSCRYVRQLRSHLSKEHSIKMDTELKNFRSEEGLSLSHNSSCVNQDYSTHTACTLRCVVLGCMSVNLHAKEETTKAHDN